MSKFPQFTLPLVAAATLLLVSANAYAQPELPRPSPSAKVSQVIGLTEITVDYSCPAVKGRPIWGALVPYDQMWRTGANQATKITFSRDVTFGDKPVPAGTYALFTIPAKGAWTVILNKKAEQSGTARDYKADLDLVRFQVHAKPAPHRERMTFLFSDFTDDKGTLDLGMGQVAHFHSHQGGHRRAGAGQHHQGHRRRVANLRQRRPLPRRDQEGLRHRAQVHRPVAQLERGLVQCVDQGHAPGRQGQDQGRHRSRRESLRLGQKAEFFFLEPEIKKTLAEWKKKG
jgi:hypothetical protein